MAASKAAAAAKNAEVEAIKTKERADAIAAEEAAAAQAAEAAQARAEQLAKLSQEGRDAIAAREALEIELEGKSVYERKRALVAFDKAEKLRQAEEDKEKKELEAAEKKAKKAQFVGKWQPAAHTPGLSDAQVEANKTARAISKFSAPKPKDLTWSEPEAEPEFDPQARYMVTSKHLATLARPVGAAKKMIEDQAEEVAAELAETFSRAAITTTMYVEILTWTFWNKKSGDDFEVRMRRLVDDDMQAEALFNVFRLPQEKGKNAGNEFLNSEVNYMTIAIGTCEQYTDMHRAVDYRSEFNHGLTKQIRMQAGIKKINGTFYAQAIPAGAQAVIDDWNSDAQNDIAIVTHVTNRLGVPGGWATVARYVSENLDDNDLLITVGKDIATSAAALEGTGNWRDIYRAEYKKVAPEMAEFAVFKGWCTPIDVQCTRSDKITMDTFSLTSASMESEARAAVAADPAKECEGLTSRQIVIAGPGSKTPELQDHITKLRATKGIILIEAQLVV